MWNLSTSPELRINVRQHPLPLGNSPDSGATIHNRKSHCIPAQLPTVHAIERAAE